MTNGSTDLNNVTEEEGKRQTNGIGFNYQPLNRKQRNRKIAYAVEDHGMIRKEEYNKGSEVTVVYSMSCASNNKTVLEPSQEHQYAKKTTRPWICYHCKRKGHIRPFCYKLYGYPSKFNHKWMPKSVNVGLVGHISKGSTSNVIWYFDSGCSKHMTGNVNYFEYIRHCEKRCVTFGDGGKGEIRGKGKLISDKLTKLDNVLFVEGLFSNLISVSQLCDQGLEVSFNKLGCRIKNEKGQVIMRGSRTKNNCYKWIPECEEQNDMLHRMLDDEQNRKCTVLPM